jgi:hypothetical protein
MGWPAHIFFPLWPPDRAGQLIDGVSHLFDFLS